MKKKNHGAQQLGQADVIDEHHFGSFSHEKQINYSRFPTLHFNSITFSVVSLRPVGRIFDLGRPALQK